MPSHPSDPLSATDHARLAKERQARHEALLCQRIRGIRHADRSLSPRRIAAHVGVATAYVEEVLGERSPPGS